MSLAERHLILFDPHFHPAKMLSSHFEQKILLGIMVPSPAHPRRSLAGCDQEVARSFSAWGPATRSLAGRAYAYRPAGRRCRGKYCCGGGEEIRTLDTGFS